MTRRSSSDLELARRLRRGDEGAFARFFDEYFPRLFRFALARCGGDEAVAGDLVQAGLVRAVENLGSYRGEAALYTWLCAIVRRLAADRHRRLGWEREVELAEDQPAVRAALEALAGDGHEPEADLERREVRRRVHAVLDYLPASYGRALELRYLEGCSIPDVAARLGLGYKAAESVLSRARRAFREGFEALHGTAVNPRETIP